MATPIAHLWTARMYTDGHPHMDVAPFFIGAVFPDIRYLGTIDRSVTHAASADESKRFATEPPFASGVLFHQLLDMYEHPFAYTLATDLKLDQHPHIYSSIKLFEDEVLFSRLTNWDQLESIFQSPRPEEIAFGVSPEIIQRWHQHLRAYCTQPPSPSTRTPLYRAIGVPLEDDQIIEQLITSLRSTPKVRESITSFYDHFLQTYCGTGD